MPTAPREQEIAPDPGQTLTLPYAIDLAYRNQPRLKASLESIQQARGREDIAFAAFLPVVAGGYSAGAFDLNVGGAGIPIPGSPGSPAYNFFPPGSALPVGLSISSNYELAELKL